MKFWRSDQAIRQATSAVVVAVAVFAAVVSYSHIYDLGRSHAQDGTAARLLPLSVDGAILAASLVLLHEARNNRNAPGLARVMLWAGIGATVAANAIYGASAGVLGAVISAWPALAFVGSVELAMVLAQRSRGPAAPGNKATVVPEPVLDLLGDDVPGWSDPLAVPSWPAPEPTAEPVPAPPAEPVPDPPAEPVPAPASASNKATGRRGHELLEDPPAEMVAAIRAGTSADELVSRFPGIKPYRAKQLVKLHRASSNGHNLKEETG